MNLGEYNASVQIPLQCVEYNSLSGGQEAIPVYFEIPCSSLCLPLREREYFYSRKILGLIMIQGDDVQYSLHHFIARDIFCFLTTELFQCFDEQ